MPVFLKSFAVAAVLALLAIPPAARALDESDLPETLRTGYVGPIVGPENDEAYSRGHLGIVRPGYGRASLYVAFRLMQLAPGVVASESHERLGNGFLQRKFMPYRSGAPEIADWLRARGALVSTPPQTQPDYFRTSRKTIPGRNGAPVFDFTATEGNCGADAFAFATRMLGELVTDTKLADTDRRTWIAGQDAVFARCVWQPGTSPAPALPAELPSKTMPKLKALRDYQHAAALFYGGDFEHSRQEFDAIAATPGHPMRAWAALGALRSVLRPAALDKDWQAAFDDAYQQQGLRDAALAAALAPAAVKHRALAESAMADVDARVKAIDANPAFADAKASAQYTARRALVQLAPARVVFWTMDALDHADWNPYTAGILDQWTQYYMRVLPDRPSGQALDFLRKHTFYDWIVSVQACGDAIRPPDETVCGAEHAHAQARWQETKRNDWLMATLMTARQPKAADLPAADAARAVSRDRPEWASLQYYASRVLRAQGRKDDALKVLDRLAGAPEFEFEPRDSKLIETERQALAR